ncbi:MAG: queuosine precursor transporter [Alphaproteobacteria bacterium]|mgnify:FL=1|tara:strand:+ start:614 stop:1312 length:699 start_codon:yes stop_codon:yes gene_type:complete
MTNIKPQTRNEVSSLFMIITVAFVTCLIVSNITAVKLITLGNIILPGAIVVFPITYIISDVLTEVYGYRRARRVIWVGFAANILAVGTFIIVGMLPAASFWEDQKAYDTILGATPRILVASLIAYLVGEFTNSYVLSKLKIMTNGRFLWVRTIGSTIIGQSLDSTIFILVAFTGILPNNVLFMTILVQVLAKTAYEFVATPITYLVVGWLKRVEKIDAFDRNISFNPFNTSV